MLTTKITQQRGGDTPIYVGIDGGGSKCRAVIYQNDRVLGTGVSGPANPFNGFDAAIHSVLTATNKALADAQLPPQTIAELIAGVGLAGVNLPHLFDQVNQWSHPFKMMFLTTDLHIACLGAHQSQNGAVIITGTGSCGYSSSAKEPLILGAHGFPHGDKGSGAWIGFSAVEHVLLAMDGLAEPSILTETVPAALNCRTDLEMVEAINGQKSCYFAKLAILVFNAAKEGDAVATKILRDGAAYISELARKLLQTQPARLSMIGGLAPFLIPYLDYDISQILEAPIAPPEIGAVFFAQTKLAEQAAQNTQPFTLPLPKINAEA